MYDFFGIEYKQGKIDFIISVFPMKFIINNYKVLIYGDNKENGADPIYGYQRAPKPSHYNKISREIIKDINSQVSTNSIVLGINKDDFYKNFDVDIINKTSFNQVLNFKTNSDIINTRFRVIDGQHRIKGFEKALLENNEPSNIAEYQVSVVIMLLDKNYRRPEETAFTNINSKAKPLKMDLTKLAEYKYALKEKPEDLSIENYLIVSVIKNLNLGKICEYWRNGIIFDVNAPNPIGIVGLKGFYDTIEKICLSEIKNEMGKISQMPFDNKKEFLDEKADKLTEEIGKCWNIVFEKWKAIRKNEIYDSGELYITYYDESYYLQKTIGVMAINGLIFECQNTGGFERFEAIIKNSNLTIENWKKNSLFAGLSSAGGANKIKQYIKNEIPIDYIF